MFNGPEDDPAQEAPEAATGGAEAPSADGTETPTEPLPEGNVE